jgi:hypothetical protein
VFIENVKEQIIMIQVALDFYTASIALVTSNARVAVVLIQYVNLILTLSVLPRRRNVMETWIVKVNVVETNNAKMIIRFVLQQLKVSYD